MPTLTDLDSFQHQIVELNNSGAGAWYLVPVAQGSPPAHSYTDITFDTSVVRTPLHACSLKMAFNTTRASQIRKTFAGGAVMVVSFYIRATAAPSTALTKVFVFGAPTNGEIGLTTSGFIRAHIGVGAWTDDNVNICDGEWHRIDAKYDRTTTSGTLDVQVDGRALTQVTGTVTGGNATDWNIAGTAVAEANLDIWYSDMIVGNTAGDYPFGDHICRKLEINGTGTHNKGAVTWSDEAGNTTDAELLNSVDDAWDGTTPNLTQTGEDHVKQSTISATNYLEFTFADPAETTIWDAEYSVLIAALDSATADTARATFIANAQTLGDTGTIDPSTSATSYNGYRGIMTKPAGGWDGTKLAGATVRMGYSSDVTPEPVWNSAIIEYATAHGLIEGVAITASVSLPTGSLSVPAGDTITATALTVTPSLPTGNVGSSQVLGVAVEATPSLPTGNVGSSQVLGVVITVTPELPAGSLAAGGATITGVALEAAPSLPTGNLGSSQVLGVVVTATPSLPVGVLGVIQVRAVVLTITPTLPVGLVGAFTDHHRHPGTHGSDWHVTMGAEPHASRTASQKRAPGVSSQNDHRQPGTSSQNDHRLPGTHTEDHHR